MSKETPDYTTLLNSLQSGKDVKALDELYNLSRKRLFALAYTVLKNEEFAKDVVQDFFIDFWENELFKRVKGSLQSYMTRSVWNRAINYKQRQPTSVQLNVDLDFTYDHPHYYSIENQELNLVISSAINKLSPMVKKVFTMHYIQDLCYSDISEQLGISKGTISNHMGKALKKLRTDLKKVYKK